MTHTISTGPTTFDLLHKMQMLQSKANEMFEDTPKFQLRGSKIGSKYIPYELVKDLASSELSDKFLKNRVSLSFRGLFNHGVESLKIYIAEEIITQVEKFEHIWTMTIETEGDINHFRADLMFESEKDIKKMENYLVVEKLSKE